MGTARRREGEAVNMRRRVEEGTSGRGKGRTRREARWKGKAYLPHTCKQMSPTRSVSVIYEARMSPSPGYIHRVPQYSMKRTRSGLSSTIIQDGGSRAETRTYWSKPCRRCPWPGPSHEPQSQPHRAGCIPSTPDCRGLQAGSTASRRKFTRCTE